MKRLEFHISYICNHYCIFCSEYDRLKAYKHNPLNVFQIKTILLDRKKNWFNHVNFTWWEPTIIPGFLDILSFAKKIGYTIYVWTNGTMFASEEFSKEALKYIDELSLSIHWYDSESCFTQTWSKQHFEIFKKISKNIKQYHTGNFFFSNVVINKYNYKNTLDIIKFIKQSDYPVQQILVSNIAPEWLADHDYEKLVFDLLDFSKYLDSIISFVREKNIILRFFWLPTCILWDKYKEYSNDAHWEERHTIERFTNHEGKIILKDIYSPDNSRKRCFVEKCEGCEYKISPCTWIFKKYLDYYIF